MWNGTWRAEQVSGLHKLTAEADGVGISLSLEVGNGPVLHGEKGLSQKGAAVGNASFYYSYPRMRTVGSVTVNGATFAVAGGSWMDHEFSTSFLEKGQRGWDWFSIQLDDGSDLMLYQMRRSDGSTDPFSSGTHVATDGQITHLTAADFSLTPQGSWKSSITGAEYPIRWEIRCPTIGLSLTVEPAFDSQEMATEATTGLAYWEGSIRVKGRRAEQPVTGVGYLELTGYTDTELGAVFGR